jgi:hypothetical protein
VLPARVGSRLCPLPPFAAMNNEVELHRSEMRPGYEYATTKGPRKVWKDESLPPAGNGWERNLDAGQNGWERFAHHEEAYWKRRLDFENSLPDPHFTAIHTLSDLSTRLSDFIQEGIESGTFDNYGDLKLCVTNFLTLHQK